METLQSSKEPSACVQTYCSESSEIKLLSYSLSRLNDCPQEASDPREASCSSPNYWRDSCPHPHWWPDRPRQSGRDTQAQAPRSLGDKAANFWEMEERSPEEGSEKFVWEDKTGDKRYFVNIDHQCKVKLCYFIHLQDLRLSFFSWLQSSNFLQWLSFFCEYFLQPLSLLVS